MQWALTPESRAIRRERGSISVPQYSACCSRYVHAVRTTCALLLTVAQTVTNVHKQKEAEATAAAAKALEAAKEKDSSKTANDLATTKKNLEESQAQLNQLKGDNTKLQKEVADAAAYKSKVR